MRVKRSAFLLFVLALLLILVIAPVAQADLVASTVYFETPQTLHIPYSTATVTAQGADILMQDFSVDGNFYQDASFSFSFTGGIGSLLITKGATVLYSANIANATINPKFGGTLYQIEGEISPSAVGSPLYSFDYGQINLSFEADGDYLQGYFQTYKDVPKTPIPGAVWLLGTGLFGLIVIRRRKKL